MNYSFSDFLTLIGSLGLFLYGMKLMSESLQKVAGNNLRAILAAMTKNRLMGVLTGVLVTALIQSSSATTVMVVSFVNAGLLNLVQSITVIMGANIGTTITGWIITLFGFKVSIADMAIPLLAFAIPLLFSNKGQRKSWGEFIMGFALLFLGLDYLKNAVPDLKANPEMLAFLSQYIDLGYLSVFLFVFIGTILTIVVQSSSATMAITLIMCSEGWIPYEMAAAMVLGENIGTTITANLAAIQANTSAKRAAFAHLTFNIFGVIWMLCLFFPFTRFIANITTGDPNALYDYITHTDKALLDKALITDLQVSTAAALSLFHTIFNIINTFLMIWVVKTIAKLVSIVIKQKDTDEEFQLTYISTGLLSTSELSILQAGKEIQLFGNRTKKMFDMVNELYEETNENNFIKTYSRIEKYEGICDRIEVEIARYLTSVSDGRLSDKSKHQIQTMLRVVSEIESVGDSCFNLARIIQRKRNDKAAYTQQLDENIQIMFKLLEEAIDNMVKSLDSELYSDDEFNRALNIETELNNFRTQLKNQNIIDVKNKVYDYPSSVTYMDAVVECETMGDYIINVMEAIRDRVK